MSGPPEDGYVDLAGSIGGDFYAVNGYDPEFMLCMKSDNGNLQLYICNNGLPSNMAPNCMKTACTSPAILMQSSLKAAHPGTTVKTNVTG